MHARDVVSLSETPRRRYASFHLTRRARRYFNGCMCAAAERRLPRPHYAEDVRALVEYGFAGLKVDR